MERLTCLRPAGLSSPQQRTSDFKKKGSGIDKRALRLHRRSIDQRKMRDAALVKQRGIETLSPLKEVQNVVTKKGKNVAAKEKPPAQNELRNRLKKWKEEKELKKKLERERKLKHPAFKIRHIVYDDANSKKQPAATKSTTSRVTQSMSRNTTQKQTAATKSTTTRVTQSMSRNTAQKQPAATKSTTSRVTRSMRRNTTQEQPAATKSATSRVTRSRSRNTTQEQPAATKSATSRVTRSRSRNTAQKTSRSRASPPYSCSSNSSQEESSSQEECSSQDEQRKELSQNEQRKEPSNPFVLPSINVTRRGDAVDTFLQDSSFFPVDFKFNFALSMPSQDAAKEARRCSSTPMNNGEEIFKFVSPAVSAIKGVQPSSSEMLIPSGSLIDEETDILKPCDQKTQKSSEQKSVETEITQQNATKTVEMEIPEPKFVETEITEQNAPKSVETEITEQIAPPKSVVTEITEQNAPKTEEMEIPEPSQLKVGETYVIESTCSQTKSVETEIPEPSKKEYQETEVPKSNEQKASEVEMSEAAASEPDFCKPEACGVSNPAETEEQCQMQVSQDSSKMTETPAVVEEEKNVPYFRNLVTSETNRLNDLCSKWQKTMNASQLSEEVLGEIRCTTGKAQLLIAQRFKQFIGLVDNCEFDRGEKKTHCSDLIGFWEMVYYQVEDVDKMFGDLDKLKANNWQKEKPVAKKVKKVTTKKPKASAASKKTAADRTAARQRLMAAKAAMKAKATRSKDSEKVVFDAGFFKVESPVKKSPTVHAHCEAGSPLSAKFFKRTSSTPSNPNSRPGSRQGTPMQTFTPTNPSKSGSRQGTPRQTFTPTNPNSRPGSRQGTPRQAFIPSNPLLSNLCTPISKLALTDIASSPKTASKRSSPSEDAKVNQDLITMDDIPSPEGPYSKVVIRESVAHPLIPGIASPHLSNETNRSDGHCIFTPPSTHTTTASETELICFDSPLAPSLAPPIPLQTPSSTATGSVLCYAAVDPNTTTDLLMMSPVRRSSRLRSASGPGGQMVVDKLADVSEPFGFRPNQSLI